MIDNITRDKILDAANIVDVVGDFVTLKRAGANYKGLCPFHDDRTPSFMVSPAKNYCKCFACGKGGNPVGFIMEHEQLSYPDALRWLAKKYGITIEEKEMTAEEKASKTERDSLFIVNEWANKWFQDQMRNTQDGRAIGLAYFRGRGFRDDIIEKFQLGYCPSQRDACTQAALKAGYQEKFLTSDPDAEGIAHGVGISIKRDNGTLFDRFSGRVMFPIFTISGKVVGFGGRVLDSATKGVNVKYQNSPESIIYHKKSELYGLFQAKQAIVKQDCVFMVEGYTDVMAMHQNGVENVVASSGTALTHEQIRLIHRFTSNIVVLYDGDAAGIKASQRGIDMLLRDGMNVKLMLLPDGQDPDEFGRKHTAQEFQQYMQDHQIDFIRFKTNLLIKEAQGDPIKMSRLVNNIVQSIAVIPDEITRTFYIRETAQMMDLREQLITDAVSKQLKINIEEWKKEKEREERRRNSPLQNSPQAAMPPSGQNQTSGSQGIGSQEGTVSSAPQDIQAGTTSSPQSYQSDGLPPADYDPSDIPPHDFGEFIPPEEFSQATSTQGAYQPSTSGNAASTNERTDAGYTSSIVDVPGERLIIQSLIRYGETVICNAEDENGQEAPITVIEFIYYALQEDKLYFSVPLYQQVLQLGMEHVHDKGFASERFFLNHPDQQINSLAFELSVDKEQLSKFHSRGQEENRQQQYNELMDLVTHLLADFKFSIVQRQKKEIMQEMRNPEVLKDRDRYRAIMQRLQELKVLESRMAKECGDRVIT